MTGAGSGGPWPRSLRLASAGLVAAGLLGLVLSGVATLRQAGSLHFWGLAGSVTAERLLPLIATGLLLAQQSGRRLGVMVGLLIAGLCLGFALRDDLILWLVRLPGAATHYFMSGPIACLLAGLLLVLPPGWRFWPGVAVILPLGAMLALATDFADPTFHDRTYLPLALLAIGVVILATALAAATLAQRFAGAWSAIAPRVIGSWVLAIGLLYGGAYVASGERQIRPLPFVEPVADANAASRAAPGPGLEPYIGFTPVLQALDGLARAAPAREKRP